MISKRFPQEKSFSFGNFKVFHKALKLFFESNSEYNIFLRKIK